MRKIVSHIADAPYRLGALVAVASMSISEAASAQTSSGVGGMATTVNGQTDAVGKLLLSGCFLGGLGFVGAGLMKLKAASDSQGREPYGPGLWRLGVGGGMVAIPTFTSTFRDTFTGGNTATIGVGNATFTN